jgi:hypothetical protein
MRMERSDGRGTIETYQLVTAIPFDYEDRRLALLQLEDIDVSHGICDECLEKQLRGLNR